mgnify:FL=1
MKRLVVVLVIVGFASFLTAQDEEEDPRIKRAIKRAVAWLKSQQKADGHWEYNTDRPFKLDIVMYEGCTALALFALLKGGVDPDDVCIKKGFAYLEKHPPKYTYSVACYVLALDALYEARFKKREKKKLEKKGRKSMTAVIDETYNPKKDVKKWAPKDLEKLKELIRWLVEHRTQRVWRYPPNGEDMSNTQYAVLALAVALRRGIPVPKEVFVKIAEYCIEAQEKDGPEVPWFPVPLADKPIKVLKKLERKIEREIAKFVRAARRSKQKVTKEDIKQLRTSVIRESADKIFRGEKKKMFARGWCYMFTEKNLQQSEWRLMITGAMTTSGIAALCVCKRALEGTPEWRCLKGKVEQSIRDGAAWIAHHFTVTANPVGKLYPGGKNGKKPSRPTIHHFYFLYGLERSGILGLIPKFGKHDWFKEGAEYLLGCQNPDGHWDAGLYGTSGPVPDTCWAILFLKKATIPIVRVPCDVATGLAEWFKNKK